MPMPFDYCYSTDSPALPARASLAGLYSKTWPGATSWRSC